MQQFSTQKHITASSAVLCKRHSQDSLLFLFFTFIYPLLPPPPSNPSVGSHIKTNTAQTHKHTYTQIHFSDVVNTTFTFFQSVWATSLWWRKENPKQCLLLWKIVLSEDAFSKLCEGEFREVKCAHCFERIWSWMHKKKTTTIKRLLSALHFTTWLFFHVVGVLSMPSSSAHGQLTLPFANRLSNLCIYHRIMSISSGPFVRPDTYSTTTITISLSNECTLKNPFKDPFIFLASLLLKSAANTTNSQWTSFSFSFISTQKKENVSIFYSFKSNAEGKNSLLSDCVTVCRRRAPAHYYCVFPAIQLPGKLMH